MSSNHLGDTFAEQQDDSTVGTEEDEDLPLLVFTSRTALIEAVDRYMDGDPLFQNIEHWDVSQIENFSHVFDADRNDRLRAFNADLPAWNDVLWLPALVGTEEDEDLPRWNVGNVRDFESMFFFA